MSSRAAIFRERLATGPILLLPGAFNALSARIIQEAGFEAVYASGAGIANAYLGVPDLGVLRPDEYFANLRAIGDATSLPVVADLDTGHGGVHNVGRAIREAELAGAVAVQIEDQVFPKRCGHFGSKALVPAREMAAKILAAADSRRDPATVIIARTDAIAPEGFDAAMERATLYRRAGADVIFVEALETDEQIRRAGAIVEAPKLFNAVEGGMSPLMPTAELETLGYRIALFANFALRAAAKAMTDAMRDFRSVGTTVDLQHRIFGWDERQRLVGFPEFERRESDWLARADRLPGTDGNAG